MGEILDTTLKVSSGFSFLLLFLQSEFSHWHVALLILQTQSVKKPSTRAVSCQWCRQQDANQRPWHWQMANLHLVCQCPKNDHKVEYAFRHRYLVIDATKACPQVLGQIQSVSSQAPCCQPQCQVQGFKLAMHKALGDFMKGLHLYMYRRKTSSHGKSKQEENKW